MALDTVVIKITGDTKQIKSTIDQLEKVGKVDRQNAASFKKTSKQQGKALDFVKGKALALGGALLGAFAIQAVVGGAINILKEFEKELSTLQSITGLTTKEMEFFSKAAKEVGKVTKTSAVDVVRAFTLIGSAQPELLKNSKALAAVTKQALILSKAAGIDATEAALALTGAMNQFGASAEDAAKFTDIFATSQQKGSSFIRDTSEALRLVGASADAVGLSFETTNAAIQALAKGSLLGSQAGTSLNAVLAQLSKQNDDKINPSIVGLSKALEELERRQLSFKEATELVQIEGAKGLLTLIKQRDIFEELDGTLNETGNALEQMRINTDNLDGSLEELGFAFEGFVLNLSGSDGILRSIVDTLAALVRGISSADFALSIFATRQKLSTRELELTGEALEETIKQRKKLLKVIEENNDAETVAAFKASLTALELRLEAEQAKALAEATEDGTEATEDAENEEAKRAKTIGELEKELTNLKTAQKKLIPLSKELAINQARVSAIQALLKGEVEKSIGPFALLTKRISDLKKELQNQSIAGNINKDIIKELNDAIDELTTAEVKLAQAISGGTKAMESQKISFEDAGEAQVKIVKLTGETVLSQIEKERIARERLETKRLDAINLVSEAEQRAFNILARINTNKLIAIDSVETKALRALDAEGLGEEELAKRKLAIQQKADQERAIILTKQAKADKAAAIIAATINTAQAVTKALATTNIALAVIVGVLGAVEIGVIASQPIPTFHEGKKSELKEGEMFAKILKTESVIPPEQSRKYKGAIDSMIDKKFESYVFQEYMLPLMKNMAKSQSSNPYDDIHIWNNQKKQIRLMSESNNLTRTMIKAMDSGHHRRSWR